MHIDSISPHKQLRLSMIFFYIQIREKKKVELALNNNHSPSWQIICNFLTVYLLKLYYLTMIAYLRNKMHKYSNQCNCTSNKRNVLPHSDHTSYIYWISFCEHFLHCWFTPTNMTILYCYNSIYYIISKIFFFIFFFYQCCYKM